MNIEPLALLTNLRAWAVGFAAWLVIDLSAGWSTDDGTYRSSARGVGAFFAFFLIVRMVRILWPMRAAGATKLVAGGRTNVVHTFTGRTSDVATTTTTTSNTHGSVWNVGSTVSGNIRTDIQTTRRQDFFLNDDDGVARGFTLRHDQIMLGQNQWVTAAWAIPPLRRRGRCVAFVNQSQRTCLFPGNELAVLAMGGSPALATLWTFLTLGAFMVAGSGPGIALGFAGLLFLIVGSRLQASYFKHIGSRPLVSRLSAGHATHAVAPRVQPQGTSAPAPAPASAAAPAQAAVALPPAVLAPPPPPPRAPAAWLTDPQRRHELRWWDGSRWTEHVSDAGSPSTDPA